MNAPTKTKRIAPPLRTRSPKDFSLKPGEKITETGPFKVLDLTGGITVRFAMEEDAPPGTVVVAKYGGFYPRGLLQVVAGDEGASFTLEFSPLIRRHRWPVPPRPEVRY